MQLVQEVFEYVPCVVLGTVSGGWRIQQGTGKKKKKSCLNLNLNRVLLVCSLLDANTSEHVSDVQSETHCVSLLAYLIQAGTMSVMYVLLSPASRTVPDTWHMPSK